MKRLLDVSLTAALLVLSAPLQILLGLADDSIRRVRLRARPSHASDPESRDWVPPCRG